MPTVMRSLLPWRRALNQKSISIPPYITGMSMITYASDEEPKIFSFESADSLNSELLDGEIQSLCKKSMRLK